MAVIPLPRLDLDSGRIERDIRGSLMQTPHFLIEQENIQLNGDGQDDNDSQVQDMFVSFLAFGGVN
jgi:hypothetical protein